MPDQQTDRTERSLRALAREQGTPGRLSIESVLTMLEMRDERIRELLEFQSEVIREQCRARRTPKGER